jgi:hypothetical protein
MSVFVLVSGSLWKNPEQRSSSKTGKLFTTASIRTSSADNAAADFWNLLIFSETVAAELMRLSEGDKLAAQGSLKLEIYNGKISRSVFVDAILPLRAPPREKKPKKAAAPEERPLERANIVPSTASPDLDDDIPF